MIHVSTTSIPPIRVIARKSEQAFPRQRFHDLRHLAASLMLEGRVDLKTISDVLGHSQIGITANLYAHLAPSLQREAANALEAVLGAAS